MTVTLLSVMLFSFSHQKEENYSLTVHVKDLRNSEGTVLFALYNREDAFPDEHSKKYLRKLSGKIDNRISSVTFQNLPAGTYAVNILHDENNDGIIKKGIILPKEGIGFSNYQSLGLSNRPTFAGSSFNLNGNMKIGVKIMYLKKKRSFFSDVPQASFMVKEST